MLVAADTVPALSRARPGRTMKQIALGSTDKQISLLAESKAEAKRSFRVVGEVAELVSSLILNAVATSAFITASAPT
jgi:hypothetical protein